MNDTKNTFDFEKAIEKSLKGILESYFNSRYKLIKNGDSYVIKDKNTNTNIYDDIFLKSIAKTAVYCLVTNRKLYLHQLINLDKQYEKLYSDYCLSKYHLKHKYTIIHHRDSLEHCIEGMKSLKKAISLRIYLTVNTPAHL